MPGIDPDSLPAMIVIVSAAFVGAVVKGVTTMGLALIAAPVIALLVDIQTAILSLFLSKLVSDVAMLVESKRNFPWRSCLRMGPFILAGTVAVPAATFLLASATGSWLYVVLGVSILIFVVYQLHPRPLAIAPEHEARWGVGFGIAAGMTQGLTGVGGPYTAMYLYSLKIGTLEFVFLSSVIYLIVDLSQLFAILYLELYDRTRLFYAILNFVPVVAGTWVGIRLRGRLGAVSFRRALLVLLFLSGSAALVRGMSA